MAKGIGGGKGGDNLLWIAVGSMVAVIVDYAWSSSHFLGWNNVVGSVSKKGGKSAPITAADWLQMAGTGILGLYGHNEGGANNKISPFSFGAFMTQLITKFGFPTFGQPRYLLFDIDAQGRLVPRGTFKGG